MPPKTSSLATLQVASPCTVSWDSMEGDGRVRFCGQCRQRVYDLSSMSRKAAQALVEKAEGRLCVRFYRRADGTVLTADCPVGLRAVQRRVRLLAGAVAGALLLLVGWSVALVSVASGIGPGSSSLRSSEPFRTVLDWIDPPSSQAIMGDCAPPPVTPPAPPTKPTQGQ